MNYTLVHSPRWTDPSHTCLEVKVTFEGLGEVPFGCRGENDSDYGMEIFARTVSGEFGPIAPYVAPVPTSAEIIASLTAQIQKRLDDFAKTRNYDGILSACTYATSTVPKFATEGQYCVQVRDATWAAGYALMDEVLAGTRPVPSSISDIEADLPVLEWPI